MPENGAKCQKMVQNARKWCKMPENGAKCDGLQPRPHEHKL
jgi:hypothetical protein